VRAVLLLLLGCSSSAARPITKEQLGQRLFEDTALSDPAGQACTDCHAAELAFTDPEGNRTSAGVIQGRFGPRNAPTLTYAALIPPQRREGESVVGGVFWDGRRDTLAAQAEATLLNPLEMNNASKRDVVVKLRARHARAFNQVFGKGSLDDVDTAFAHATDAIAAFERTPVFAPFTSKYDRYRAGTVALADDEARGLAVFMDPARGNCASCHTPPLFTDFTYANLGLPRFADNPFYELPRALNPDGVAYVDRGLGQTTKDPRHDGMFRVPTLRNVLLTAPYGHNGYFRRLDEMITAHAVAPQRAEVPATVDRSKLAAFQPTREDIADLVAFLRTLTDER
jgi:cytochrome c peroxidase